MASAFATTAEMLRSSQPCAVAITRMPLLPSAVMNRPGTMGFSPMPAHGAHMEVRGA